MVSRSDTYKTIRRRTGGAGKKTGKGTSLKKINIDKYRWEDDPDFKGTVGPYNPRKKTMKKKKYDYDTYMDLGPMGPIGTISYHADWPMAKKEHIKAGRLGKKKTGVSDEDRKKYKAAGERLRSAGETHMSKSKRKGGTVKKRKKSKTKKNKIMVGYKAGGKV